MNLIQSAPQILRLGRETRYALEHLAGEGDAERLASSIVTNAVNRLAQYNRDLAVYEGRQWTDVRDCATRYDLLHEISRHLKSIFPPKMVRTPKIPDAIHEARRDRGLMDRVA